MPKKNGYEVCEAIKANPATAGIPVVLLSGTFEPFDRDRAERLGSDAIVSKPFDSQQLLRQVEDLLARAPKDAPSASTLAIPIMANPAAAAPPSPAAPPEKPAAEAGFDSEDFTGSIPRAAEIAGGPDLFEEEYGQADVESAIAAFEKAHPEFSYVEEGATEAAMRPATSDEEDETADSHREEREESAAAWERDEPARPSVPPPPPAPAPFWVPREPEPELQPIPFAGDDSTGRRRATESMRADEGPTQQIPLAADYASFRRRAEDASRDPDSERQNRITDKSPAVPPAEAEERTAEIEIAEARAAIEAAKAGTPPVPPVEEAAPVSREIEVLAQTTSIGQLKEMLSSVSRGEGGLSDDEIDRLASRVVERLSEKIVREIAWEVIPDLAEVVIKQRIKELEAGVE